MKNQQSQITFPAATTSISLKIGQYLQDGGTLLRVDAFDNGKIVLRDVASNDTKCASEHQVISAVLEGKVTIQNVGSRQKNELLHVSGSLQNRINLREESIHAVEAMLVKRAWLEALHERGIDKIVDEVWVRAVITEIGKTKLIGIHQPSIQTLANAKRQLSKCGGDWSQLVPRFSDRGGYGKARIDLRAEEIISQKLEELKHSRSRLVKERIYDSIRCEILARNIGIPENPIAMPGHMTIDRRLNKTISKYELTARNNGTKYAQKEYRSNSFPRVKTEFPLLISEYDDLDAGVFLVDIEIGLPAGRAYITHGVDRATDMPLGFDLSHEHRSYDSAIGALCDSFLPKDMSLPQFAGCKYSWDGYGVQGTVYLDNAQYNKSKSMEQQAHQAEMLLTYTKPRGPTEKRSIEYFNWITKSDFCMNLPGWRGQKKDSESVKVGMASATLDVFVFRRLYCQWVTDVYMNKPGEDGWTSRQRWQKYFGDHKPAVRWSREELAIFRLRPETYTFRPSGGVKRLNLVYDNGELKKLREQLGSSSEVVIYTDRRDLTYILAKNPYTQQFIRVACCTDFRYTHGLTEQQQKWILKDCRNRGLKNSSLSDMVESRTRLALLVEQVHISAHRGRRFRLNVDAISA